MFTFDTPIRVRYGETDQMGFLYHARYLDYYDVARTEMFRAMGLPNSELEARGYRLPVIGAAIDYAAPARYDELLTVRCHLLKPSGPKLHFEYEVFRSDGERINAGRVTLAFMAAATGRACRPPAWFMGRLRSPRPAAAR